MNDKQKKLLAWAFSELSDMVNRNAFGKLVINMQEGIIISANKDETLKAPIDKIENFK